MKNKLIFNTIKDAEDFSNKYYNGMNVIYDLNTNKVIKPSTSRKAFFNPGLYVRNASFDEIKKTRIQKDKPKVLKGFDEL